MRWARFGHGAVRGRGARAWAWPGLLGVGGCYRLLVRAKDTGALAPARRPCTNSTHRPLTLSQRPYTPPKHHRLDRPSASRVAFPSPDQGRRPPRPSPRKRGGDPTTSQLLGWGSRALYRQETSGEDPRGLGARDGFARAWLMKRMDPEAWARTCGDRVVLSGSESEAEMLLSSESCGSRYQISHVGDLRDPAGSGCSL